jgi:DNA-binding PadR family transcriptional regulator
VRKVIELAILGALKERPMHGYELKKRLSGTLGHFWSISFGSLYPALKRLEASDAIEKAYTVKEKTRNRYVYRITDAGEGLFNKLLSEPGPPSDITDPDRFNLRMAFFRYMEPESRLWLLERRRTYLQDKLDEMNRSSWSGKEKEADKYRMGLTRHRIELTESDITWLSEMIENEREQVVIKKKTTDRKRKKRKGEDAISLVLEENEGHAVPSKA